MKLKPTLQTIYVGFASLLGAYLGSQISHATPFRIGAINDVEVSKFGVAIEMLRPRQPA